MPLTGKRRTHPPCQRLALRESCCRRRLRGFVRERNPLRHGFAVPPPPKVEALARAQSLLVLFLGGFPPKNKNPGRVTRPNAPGKEDLPPVSRQKVLKQTLNLCCADLWPMRTVHDAVRKSLHLPAHQSLKRWKSPPVHCLFNRRSGFASPPKKRVCFLATLPPNSPFGRAGALVGKRQLSGSGG